MHNPHVALANLREGSRLSGRDPRHPRRCRLDAEGAGLSLELPSPVVLAETLIRPKLCERNDLYRTPDGVVQRPRGSQQDPTPVSSAALRDTVVELLRELPEIENAGRPYQDLRVLVAEGSASSLLQYAAETAAALRRRDVSPNWAPPSHPRERRTARTSAERMTTYRARCAHLERASAASWLEAALEDPYDPLPEVITAASLYDMAVTGIKSYMEDELVLEDEPGEPPMRIPGPRQFYATADRLLGPRKRTSAGYVYQIRSA